MTYTNILPAKFISRPNRFIAHCEIGGVAEVCHVKNTGRCRELLLPGAEVYVQKSDNPARKTKYDLITVRKGERLVNIDSQAPNHVFAEWLAAGGLGATTKIKPESVYGSSRFDFYVEAGPRRSSIEVKGATLEEDSVARFPDAPTERGVKHIKELCHCLRHGYEAMAVFLIQMDGVRYFTPNDQTHAAFGDALREAARLGVRLLALDCRVTPNSITAGNPVDIVL